MAGTLTTSLVRCATKHSTKYCNVGPCQNMVSLWQLLHFLVYRFYFIPLYSSFSWFFFYSGLERTNPREWPKIGLDFAERCLQLFSSQKVASLFLGLEVSSLRPLVDLRCALSDLHSLRSKYYLHVPLEDFIQVFCIGH